MLLPAAGVFAVASSTCLLYALVAEACVSVLVSAILVWLIGTIVCKAELKDWNTVLESSGIPYENATHGVDVRNFFQESCVNDEDS